jgi:hypothetical protein
LGFWHWLYWLVFFKRGGVQDQALSLTVAASPKTEVIYEDASKKKDAENLALKISQGSKSLAHTQDIVVKYLESTRTGFPDFAAFVEWCNRAIVETILLQNVTSKEAAFKGDVQEHTKEGLIASCAKELFESFTDEVISKLCYYRFGAGVNPPALRMVEEPEDAKLVLERDKLALEIGLKRTEQSRKELFPDYEELQADVKITLLNGAQQTALQALVKDCAANLIPPDTAEAMTLTYGISLEQAKTFIDPIRKTLEESKAQAEQQAAANDPFADPNAQPEGTGNPVLDQLGLDPTQLSADEVEFGKGDGYPCGRGYISKAKKCRKALDGQAKDYAGFLDSKIPKAKTQVTKQSIKIGEKSYDVPEGKLSAVYDASDAAFTKRPYKVLGSDGEFIRESNKGDGLIPVAGFASQASADNLVSKIEKQRAKPENKLKEHPDWKNERTDLIKKDLVDLIEMLGEKDKDVQNAITTLKARGESVDDILQIAKTKIERKERLQELRRQALANGSTVTNPTYLR